MTKLKMYRAFVIQDAIDAAPAGAIIIVPPGVYNEQLVIDKPLTLSGPDPASGEAVIDATGMANVPTIQILASDVTVTRLTIKNGPLHGIQAGSAAFTNLNNIIIKNNKISGHGNAGIISNHGASMLIEGNVIEGNGQETGFNRVGIVLYPHGLSEIIGNIIDNNGLDGIFARASNTGLSIKDNIISRHSNSGITLAWNQRNTTISNNKIIACGSGLSQETGGIVIIQSMAEEISNNTIQNCNRYGLFWGWTPSEGPAPEQILITDNVIEDCTQDGIFLFSQGPGGFIPPDPFPLEPLVCGNTLQNNGGAGINVSNLYYYSPGNANPAVHYNSLTGNEWGVFNGTAGIIEATNNWWGDSSGPYNSALNPEGSGDPVSDNVNFFPWLTMTITGCVVDAVKLVSYTATPLPTGKALVDLTIQVEGRVMLKNGENDSSQPFTKFINRTVELFMPEPERMTVSLLGQAACQTVSTAQGAQVNLWIFLVVHSEAEVQLLLPTYGYPPQPPRCVDPVCLEKPGCFKYELPIGATTSQIDQIETKRVFDRCCFSASIKIQVPLHAGLCPLLVP